jgi:hypothetical protein
MSYFQLAASNLSSETNSIVLNNIQTNSNMHILLLELTLRSNQVATASNVGIRINGDSGNNYATVTRTGTNAKNSNAQIPPVFANSVSYAAQLSIPASSLLVSTFSNYKIYMYGHNSSSKFCNLVSQGHGYEYNGTAGYMQEYFGTWTSTNEVTSISITNLNGNFVVGSTVSLMCLGDG